MKKILLKYVLLTITAAFMLTGCLEESEVTGPVPYTSDTRTDIDVTNPSTFNGNYKPLEYVVDPEKTNVLDILYLQGSINLYYNVSSKKLTYNYGLKYTGYNTVGDYAKNIELLDFPEYTVDEDKKTVRFNNPLIINYNNETYTINSIQKVDDNLKTITDTASLSDINTQYTLCDPREIGSSNPKSCTSINGAMKYIGYYRIDSITCSDFIYIGGKDFAGEMVTNPSLLGLDVTIPITVKIQVAESSPLKQCFLKTSESNPYNLYYTNDKYTLTGSDYQGGLSSAFTKVGLIGLNVDDNFERTSQIEYKPKDTSFKDLTFGDAGNKVTMRLKFIDQGTLNASPVKEIDNIPYTVNP